MFPSSRQREASLDNCTVGKVVEVEVEVVRVAGEAEKTEVVAKVGGGGKSGGGSKSGGSGSSSGSRNSYLT